MNESPWKKHAESIEWIRPWKKESACSYQSPVRISWFEEGTLNVSANCLDRHLKNKASQSAIVFVPNDPKDEAIHINYQELHSRVCQMAHALTQLGITKGDRVTIYLPLIPDALVSMLACARIGAVHSVVFGGFSSSSLAARIQDCQSKLVITVDASFRGDKKIEFKKNVDESLKTCPTVLSVMVFKHQSSDHGWTLKDHWAHELLKEQPQHFSPIEVESDHPLFILYTSGSTGKPKGVLHGSGGYLSYVTQTFKDVFEYREKEVFWCTADVGWITGHSYVCYGPLSVGATTLIYEGLPSFPTPSRLWEIVDQHRVNVFYTAPTAIRALEKEGNDWLLQSSRNSLRLLGTVGEPINPEAWNWYFDVVGKARCRIVDTWWQTETGGILISPRASSSHLKPGSAMFALDGIEPVLLDEQGKEIVGAGEGALCLKSSWPGQMQTVFNDHQRFEQTYFSQYKGYYFTGDGCKRDEDGYHWITGRIDDVINVSGHRIGSAEVESALVLHEDVVEAAVVGIKDDIKGLALVAFVVLLNGKTYHDQSFDQLVKLVKKEIGSFASPSMIWPVKALPKTRSGKIMRRILRKIAENDESLGDISTLADPSVVEDIVSQLRNIQN